MDISIVLKLCVRVAYIIFSFNFRLVELQLWHNCFVKRSYWVRQVWKHWHTHSLWLPSAKETNYLQIVIIIAVTEVSNQLDVGMKENILGQWIAGYLPAASTGVGCFSTYPEPARPCAPQRFDLGWERSGRSSPKIIVWRSKLTFYSMITHWI